MELTSPLAIVLLMAVFICQAKDCEEGGERACLDGSCVASGEVCSEEVEDRSGQNMTADQCPDERPLLCSDSKCYSQAEVCRGLLQHCDDMFYDYCRQGRVSLGWPWYHWVLACAFGGAACILAIYGLYLVLDRRQHRQQQEDERC